jgi:hypothetical protein
MHAFPTAWFSRRDARFGVIEAAAENRLGNAPATATASYGR